MKKQTLSDKELLRYSRNIVLKEIGIDGQLKLMNSIVLVIGAGGLGSPACLYLAAAGTGTIGIADFDIVDLSNLQRQIIHFTKDTGTSKVISAKEKINQLNPGIDVRTYNLKLDYLNIREIVRNYDFIIDATDGIDQKLLINDACLLENKPFCHCGILGFAGQIMTVIPHKTTCLRCIITENPDASDMPSCSSYGILGSVAGIAGSIQATEAIKFITESGTLMTDGLLTFDLKDMQFRKIPINRNPECRICGEHSEIKELSNITTELCDFKNNGGNK